MSSSIGKTLFAVHKIIDFNLVVLLGGVLLSTNWIAAYRSHGRLKVTVESKPKFPKSIFSCSVFVPMVARTRLKSVRFRDCYPMGLVKTLSVYMFFCATSGYCCCCSDCKVFTLKAT